MLCKNCNKEIGTQKECSFCGYNPEIDDDPSGSCNRIASDKLPETKIKLLKKKNGAATAGLIMSILSMHFIFMIPAFILNIQATSRCKSYRSGKTVCIISWLILGFYVLLYIALIALSIYLNFNAGTGTLI